jgi:hydrogenase nickel incorporation protein HypA/HybF
MHEYSIVSALLDRVEAEARRHTRAEVLGIRVRVGELSGVDGELLRTAWSLFREGTLCAHAEIELAGEAARWVCPRCARDIEAGAALRCPGCAVPARLASGDALVLERIEMEVGDV